MVVRLATRSPAGRPFVTPIWFVLHGRRVVMATSRQSMSARNLEANPEAVLLFEADRREAGASVLRLRGLASVRHTVPSLGVFLRIGLKYYLSAGGLRSELANLHRLGLRQRYYAQSQPAVIEVTPQSVELLPCPR
jgi:hypothetical protein